LDMWDILLLLYLHPLKKCGFALCLLDQGRSLPGRRLADPRKHYASRSEFGPSMNDWTSLSKAW